MVVSSSYSSVSHGIRDIKSSLSLKSEEYHSNVTKTLTPTLEHRYDKDLEKDDTKSLVYRLRNNVLKTGLRRISISYSRISFQDIASKLSLKSANEAECVCAKAIRDGVVDAVLDHKQGFMRSKETIDTYSTNQPRKALHLRTSFCLDIHNEAVKAMRYPPDAFKIKNDEDEETKCEKDREDAKREAEEDEKEGDE